MSVAVVIPALNEAESIGAVLAAIPAQTVDEVIVVDGGSSDDTLMIAEAAGARTVRELRRGYGRACATGAANARADIVVFLDADGSDDPAQIPVLLAPILNGQADLVVGTRLAGELEPGVMPWHQQAGNRLAAWWIRHLYGVRVTDLGPFRAIRRDVLAHLQMQEMTYGWPTEMIVKAIGQGWRLAEVPVRYQSRLSGRSKISGTVRGTVLAAWHILYTIARYARTRKE